MSGSRVLVGFFGIGVVVWGSTSDAWADGQASTNPYGRAQFVHPFVPNRGQADPSVAFYVHTREGTQHVTHQGTMRLAIPAPQTDGSPVVLEETVVGSGPEGLRVSDPVATRISHFSGRDPARWQKELPGFREVVLVSVRPQIDLRLRSRANRVERMFEVHPGGDPSNIRVRVGGVDSVRVLEEGSLRFETLHGPITLTAPEAFQWIDGRRRPVEVSYRVIDQGYGFRISAYDPNVPLTIDPLLQSTYIGGSRNDQLLDMKQDRSSTYIYGTGTTASIIEGGPLSVRKGLDVFVARWNRDLTELLSLAYVVGDGDDFGNALAFYSLPAGPWVYVAGRTSSSDLPGIDENSADSTYGGSEDGFVVSLSSDLSEVLSATYLGGSTAHQDAHFPIDEITEMEFARVDLQPEIVVVGNTGSMNLTGAGSGGEQGGYGGGERDGFIARLSLQLDDVTTTYFGEDGKDLLTALFVPDDGPIFVAGTLDDEYEGPEDPQIVDLMVASLPRSLTEPWTQIRLPGDGENGAAFVLDTTAGLFVGGNTTSTDLPVESGALMAEPNDMYVCRLGAELAVEVCTYLGGSGADVMQDALWHPHDEHLILVGGTRSDDLPGTTGGLQPVLNGSADGFLMEVLPSLDTLVQSTYLGGPDSPEETITTIRWSENLVMMLVAGITTSGEFPRVEGGAQSFMGGGIANYTEGFVAQLRTLLHGGGGDMSVTPDVANMGEMALFDRKEQQFTLSNVGTGQLLVSGYELTGSTDFRVTSDAGPSPCPPQTSVPFPLDAGAACTLTVELLPRTEGDAAGWLEIQSSDSSEPTVTVELHGSAVEGDQDGIPAADEVVLLDYDYDGNGDGLPDRKQDNVATLPSLTTTQHVTIAVPEPLRLRNVRAVPSPTPEPPPGLFPFDFFEFEIHGLPPGGVATATLYFPPGTRLERYWKYGPRPPAVPADWYAFDYDKARGAVIEENVVTLHFSDGRWGDHDLDTTNGIIVDPGGAEIAGGPGDGDGQSSGGCSCDTVASREAALTFALFLLLVVSVAESRFRRGA